MLGKNNVTGYDRLNEKSTFGLRKLSVGVASVLLGSSWLMLNNVAHADTVAVNGDQSADQTNNTRGVIQPYRSVQQTVMGANSRSLVVASPDSIPVNVQSPSDMQSTSSTVDNSVQNSSAVANGNVSNDSIAITNNGSAHLAQELTVQPQASQSSSVANQYVTAKNSNSFDNIYGVTKGYELFRPNGDNTPQFKSVNYTIYDITNGFQRVDSSSKYCEDGTTEDFRDNITMTMAAHQKSTDQYEIVGSTREYIDSFSSSEIFYIKHKLRNVEQTININQQVLLKGKVAGSKALPALTRNGKQDLYNHQYHWNGFSSLSQSSTATPVKIKYGYYAVADPNGADVLVNGQRVASSSRLYSPSAPKFGAIDHVINYHFPQYNDSTVDVVLASSQQILNTVMESLPQNSSSNQAIDVTVKTPIALRDFNEMVGFKFLMSSKNQGYSSDTFHAVPLFSWYTNYSLSKGFGPGLEQKLRALIPEGFKLARFQFGTQDNLSIPPADPSKLGPDNSQRALEEIATLKGIPFASADLIPIYVVPDSNANVNYRFFDAQNQSNMEHVKDAEGIIRADSSEIGEHKDTDGNTAWDPWKLVSGKRFVSDADLSALALIGNIGTDGKANGKNLDQYLKLLNQMGYNVNKDQAYDSQFYVFRNPKKDPTKNIEYSYNDGEDNIKDAIFGNLDQSVKKASLNYQARIQNLENQGNNLLKQLASANGIVNSVNAASNSLHQFMNTDLQLAATLDALSGYNFADLYNNNYYKPLKVWRGVSHLWDNFTSENPATPGTILKSGRTAGSVVTGNTDIFNRATYGDVRSYSLRVQMKRNANNQTWPASYQLGPVTGFAGNTSIGGYNFNLLTSDDKFNDSSYKPVRAGQQDVYDYKDEVQVGSGTEYSVDEVSGTVLSNKVVANFASNPVLYFPQIKGYDLLINGQKIPTSQNYYCIRPEDYLKIPKNNHDVINYTVEYAPHQATIDVKVVDQHGNVLDENKTNVNVDTGVALDSDKLAGGYIVKYNDTHKDKYMEVVSSDIPLQQFVTENDTGKTFTYTVKVKVSDVKLIDDGMDKNVRTVYFVNRSDPDNSIPAITDIARIKVQKQVVGEGNDQHETGTYVYSALDSFDDVRNRINQTLGTTNWVVVSGNEYLGSFTPTQPGGETITVEYN